MHREGDAAGEEVPGRSVIAALDPAGLLQQFRTEAVADGRRAEGVAELGHVAQLELLDDVVAEAALVEVRQADALAFFRVPKVVAAPLLRPCLDDGDALALRLFGLLLGSGLLLGQLDVVVLGEPADGLHVAVVLVLHQEADAVAAFAATEALVNAHGGHHVEAGRLLVMERAQAQVPRTLALQVHELPHHLVDTGGVLHLLDGLGADH